MDFAYDQITQQSYTSDRSTTPKPSSDSTSSTTPTEPNSTSPQSSSTSSQPPRQNLQSEFQETLATFSASPWGAKLGGWWAAARTQGATYLDTARKEAERREAEAAKALEEARRQIVQGAGRVLEQAEEGLDRVVNEDRRQLEREQEQKEKEEKSEQTPRSSNSDEATNRKDTSATTADTSTESTETLLARFKLESTKRISELKAAEDAADLALLRFGTSIRNFLKDTISITAPAPSSTNNYTNASEVLFESKDPTSGKRVIHTSRFDAQLHLIHTTAASFTSDPEESGDEGAGWDEFKRGSDIEKRTEQIAKDLETYPELRAAMERLVPERVGYEDFWRRYYFLRSVVEAQEVKRREMLKASTTQQTDEEVAWDEDSDSEAEAKNASIKDQPSTSISTSTSEPAEPSTPQPNPKTPVPSTAATTLPTHQHSRTDSDAMTLRPSRRSHDEKSVADSEASYDLVSGAASHANSSPKERNKGAEESDEEDWE